MTVKILVGDCLEGMSFLPSGIADTCVTSPPYFGLRDYGHEDQIGLEATPDEFVEALVKVFREVRRVLKDDGTLWLNLGDSYAGGNTGGKWREGSARADGEVRGDGATSRRNRNGTGAVRGVKTKDLIGIPWRVAFALQADGWHLRQDIIWHKPNPMPESVKDRCTKAHEYLFLLTKNPRYYFDAKAIEEPAKWERWGDQTENKAHEHAAKFLGGKKVSELPIRDKKNKRSVWTVPTGGGYKGAHFAVFPPALIEPCVLAGSRLGGLVFDPFGGAGTTGLVADKLGRNAILCELNREYAEMARDRIGPSAKVM